MIIKNVWILIKLLILLIIFISALSYSNIEENMNPYFITIDFFNLIGTAISCVISIILIVNFWIFSPFSKEKYYIPNLETSLFGLLPLIHFFAYVILIIFLGDFFNYFIFIYPAINLNILFGLFSGLLLYLSIIFGLKISVKIWNNKFY